MKSLINDILVQKKTIEAILNLQGRCKQEIYSMIILYLHSSSIFNIYVQHDNNSHICVQILYIYHTEGDFVIWSEIHVLPLSFLKTNIKYDKITPTN